MAFHPVHVALQRVDFTVVRQHAERLRQPPLREGIRGVSLVINCKRGLKSFVLKVGIKLRNLLGQHHAFVDDRPARQRRDVELRHASSGSRLLDPATNNVKLALKRLFINPFGIGDQDLLNLGAGRIRFLAQAIDGDRHMPPAVDVIAHAQNFGFHNGPAGLLRAEIRARQKHLTNRHQLVHARLMACPFDLIVEKRRRDLHMNARTVTGFAIRINSTPVPDRLERRDPRLNNLARRFPVQRNHQTHTAGRMLFRLGVQTILRHPLALYLFRCNPICIVFGHGVSPSTKGCFASYCACVART